MSDTPHDPGQQFVVDAFTHHSIGHNGFVYAHLFTDLASRQVYPVFTKSKSVTRVEDSIGPKCLGTWVSDVTQHGNVGLGDDVTY